MKELIEKTVSDRRLKRSSETNGILTVCPRQRETHAQYLTAKSLINIPDNMGLVEELIKTRLLVWDKSVMDVTANPEKFDAFPELNNAFSKKGKTKTEKRK